MSLPLPDGGSVVGHLGGGRQMALYRHLAELQPPDTRMARLWSWVQIPVATPNFACGLFDVDEIAGHRFPRRSTLRVRNQRSDELRQMSTPASVAYSSIAVSSALEKSR